MGSKGTTSSAVEVVDRVLRFIEEASRRSIIRLLALLLAMGLPMLLALVILVLLVSR